eukprot:1156395-Pelagomonas_calceolata.AAC.11
MCNLNKKQLTFSIVRPLCVPSLAAKEIQSKENNRQDARSRGRERAGRREVRNSSLHYRG